MFSKLLKIISVFLLLFLLCTLPPVMSILGKKFLNPLVKELLPTIGILEPEFTLSSYSYAFPFGIKAKGLDLQFAYKYPDFNQGSYNLSADEVGVRIDFMRSLSEKDISLKFFAEGVIVRSKLLPDSQVPGSSYDYQRFVITEIQADRAIILGGSNSTFDLKNIIKTSINSWSKTPVQIIGDLEVSIYSKKHSVFIKDITEEGIVFEENLLNDLSLGYRKPFLESEKNFLSKFPLYGLDFLNFKLTAEEQAVQIFPLDLDSLAKASILLMHYNLSKNLGPEASLLIARPFGEPISSEYDLASSMGRASAKKGIPPEDLSKLEVLSNLIKTN